MYYNTYLASSNFAHNGSRHIHTPGSRAEPKSSVNATIYYQRPPHASSANTVPNTVKQINSFLKGLCLMEGLPEDPKQYAFPTQIYLLRQEGGQKH